MLDLMSHSSETGGAAARAAGRKVDELRAEGKIQGGGHV